MPRFWCFWRPGHYLQLSLQSLQFRELERSLVAKGRVLLETLLTLWATSIPGGQGRPAPPGSLPDL